MSFIRREKALLISLLAIAVLYPLEHMLLGFGLTGIALAFAGILAVILVAAFSVAHHAEALAHKYGEPYGTLILTGAAVGVEVIILVILLRDGHNPTLVRDTIYAALMLDINGILGIAAIIGGIRHGQQKYNVDSSNSYIAMILVSLGVSMLIPDFLESGQSTAYSIFNILIIGVLYALFTRIQVVEHRYFFEYPGPKQTGEKPDSHGEINGKYHGILLVALIAAIGVLAEVLSVFLNEGISQTGLPIVLAGVVVALISASPEILTAARAAMDNRMQTVINIALGASLATVLLTIPVMETVSLVMDIPLTMGLTPAQGGMVLLTMLVTMVNLNNGETNALEGLVHMVLFSAFVMVIFVLPG